ncbi:MAG TPA: LON peptidase substrate-binding domain-containing protein [Usitatibacteraceae bacterium]|nr:LON peptidase substrate-binding domain-containing protein [Usitatibacteraceae bacterium]
MNLLSAGPRPRETVPIFPLSTVLYPGTRLPLRIFEQRYMEMAKACLKHDSAFGVCLIREGEEVGTPAVPEAVGCLARIAEWDMETVGILKVKVDGLERFRLLATQTTPSGLILGDIEHIAAEDPVQAESPVQAAELEQCATFVRKVVDALGSARFTQPCRYDDASWVGFRLAEILPLRNDVKQKLLELDDPGARLAVLHRFLLERDLVD